MTVVVGPDQTVAPLIATETPNWSPAPASLTVSFATWE